MEAYELAKKIETDKEKKYGDDIQRYLARIVDKVEYEFKLSPELSLSKLEETEYGYAFLRLDKEIYRRKRSEYSPESSIIVHYFDKLLNRDYSLGRIWQLSGQRGWGHAGFFENEEEKDGLGKNIYPGDEEWDAIVGTVERALETCQKKRLSNEENSEL